MTDELNLLERLEFYSPVRAKFNMGDKATRADFDNFVKFILESKSTDFLHETLKIVLESMQVDDIMYRIDMASAIDFRRSKKKWFNDREIRQLCQMYFLAHQENMGDALEESNRLFNELHHRNQFYSPS